MVLVLDQVIFLTGKILDINKSNFVIKTTLEELKLYIEEFIEDYQSLFISNELSNEKIEFKKKYNSLIKKNIKDKAGVYIWENAVTKEIIYIGMAGRINNKGELKSHSLVKRLSASWGYFFALHFLNKLILQCVTQNN